MKNSKGRIAKPAKKKPAAKKPAKMNPKKRKPMPKAPANSSRPSKAPSEAQMLARAKFAAMVDERRRQAAGSPKAAKAKGTRGRPRKISVQPGATTITSNRADASLPAAYS